MSSKKFIQTVGRDVLHKKEARRASMDKNPTRRSSFHAEEPIDHAPLQKKLEAKSGVALISKTQVKYLVHLKHEQKTGKVDGQMSYRQESTQFISKNHRERIVYFWRFHVLQNIYCITKWMQQHLFKPLYAFVVNYIVLVISRLGEFFYCFLTGSEMDPKKLETPREELKRNDYYRDRLLEEEIDTLMDTAEALHIMHEHVLKFFQKFIELDWTRSSTISPRDLFIYCRIRRTRLVDALFAVNHKVGFRKVKGRYDIVQLMGVMFAVCTLTPQKLVESVIKIMLEDPVITAMEKNYHHNQCDKKVPDTAEVRMSHKFESDRSTIDSFQMLNQVSRLLTLVHGNLDDKLACLKSLLQELYAPSDSSHQRFNLMQIHEIESIHDIIYLYPVLIYPAFSLLRSVRNRFMGTAFWEVLRFRREELHPFGLVQLAPTNGDILAAVTLEKKIKETLPNTVGNNFFNRSRTSMRRMSLRLSSSASLVSTSFKKVIPLSARSMSFRRRRSLQEFPKPTPIQEQREFVFTQYHSMQDAWKVTADNLLVAIHIREIARENPLMPTEALSKRLSVISAQMLRGDLEEDQRRKLRKSIVRNYGYHFADFLFKLSRFSTDFLDEDEKYATARFHLAKSASQLPADKKHWQKMFDPREGKEFFYNMRTGDSVWDRPIDLIQ